MANTIDLVGCTATPLASYLKALGILRLVTRSDSTVTGYWRLGRFCLVTRLDRQGLRRYFLDEYAPTPVISPWNGRAGYLEGDDGEDSTRAGAKLLRRLRDSKAPRLGAYRTVISALDESPVLREMNANRSRRKALETEKRALQKQRLNVPANLDSELARLSAREEQLKRDALVWLRNQVPDEHLEWIDAVVALGVARFFSPLLGGSGGVEGSMDIGVNFVTNIFYLLNSDDESPSDDAEKWLDSALFQTPAPIKVSNSSGALFPGRIGGPNATSGFAAKLEINPWDFVLMLEGACLFRTSVSVRNQAATGQALTFPFTVDVTGAGAGHVQVVDESSARKEMWVPLWERPMGGSEVTALLREGRVTLGRRIPKDGLEFSRAVHKLGVDRGLSGFERYAFLKRSGDMYLATPLGRVNVQRQPQSDLIDDLDRAGWLSRFHRISKSDKAAARLRELAQRLDTALFDLSSPGPRVSRVQKALAVLGDIQTALAKSSRLREDLEPVPRLGREWAIEADDGSPAFRTSRALAGLRGELERPMPMRSHLWPTHPQVWLWVERMRKERHDDRIPPLRFVTPWRGDLIRTLNDIIVRRLWLAERCEFRDKPFRARVGLDLSDVMAFLEDAGKDVRIAELLRGLALCDLPEVISESVEPRTFVPAGWAVLKLVFSRDQTLVHLAGLPPSTRVAVPRELLRRLLAGDTSRAIQIAARRLQASGVPVVFGRRNFPDLPGALGPRLAASLLLPLSFSATRTLLRSVTKSVNE